MVNNKTIKAIVVALTLVAGSSVYAGDYVYQIVSNTRDSVNLELKAGADYSINVTLSLGQVFTWTVPQQKGCLNSIKVNGQPIRDASTAGKMVWSGTVCADHAQVVIQPGNNFSNNIPMAYISAQ